MNVIVCYLIMFIGILITATGYTLKLIIANKKIKKTESCYIDREFCIFASNKSKQEIKAVDICYIEPNLKTGCNIVCKTNKRYRPEFSYTGISANNAKKE